MGGFCRAISLSAAVALSFGRRWQPARVFPLHLLVDINGQLIVAVSWSQASDPRSIATESWCFTRTSCGRAQSSMPTCSRRHWLGSCFWSTKSPSRSCRNTDTMRKGSLLVMWLGQLFMRLFACTFCSSRNTQSVALAFSRVAATFSIFMWLRCSS